ncbi:PhnA-like protein [Rhodospirillaceae bacterium SYSU D60014]|uniref:PhnA-like protein n=1 Tax=Virgifigura deserti TaxID=2268457 RepID=UPI0013C4DBEE
MTTRTDYDLDRGASAPVTTATPMTSALRRISWGAVFAGVVISLITHLLLTTLGLGIGMSTIDPTRGGSPDATPLTLGASIWWAVSGILAALAGGWVASRLAGIPVRTDGVLHGLVTWAATTLVVIYLLTSTAGSLLGGAFGVLGNAVSGLGQAAGQAATTAASAVTGGAGNPLETLQQQARDLLAANTDNPQAAADSLTAALARIAASGGEPSPADRQTVIDILSQQTGMTPQQAEQRLQEWVNSYQQTMAQAEQQAVQAAEATTDAVSTAAISSFIALLLGAIAGAIGGRMGTPREETVLTATTTTRY